MATSVPELCERAGTFSFVQIAPCRQINWKALGLLVQAKAVRRDPLTQFATNMRSESFVILHKISVPLTHFKNLNSPELNPSRLFYLIIQCRYTKHPLNPLGAFIHLNNSFLSVAWQSRSCYYASVTCAFSGQCGARNNKHGSLCCLPRGREHKMGCSLHKCPLLHRLFCPAASVRW